MLVVLARIHIFTPVPISILAVSKVIVRRIIIGDERLVDTDISIKENVVILSILLDIISTAIRIKVTYYGYDMVCKV